MIISQETNRQDYEWLWEEWDKFIQQERMTKRISWGAANDIEFRDTYNKMKNIFGVETELFGVMIGTRTFKVVDKDKFMKEKLSRCI